MPTNTSNNETDYRGEKMSTLAEAHSLAHEADTERRLNPMCSRCGTAAAAQLRPSFEWPEKLKQCGKCKSAVYCGRDCQVADWPDHKIRCKAIVKEREAKKESERELKKSAVGVDTKQKMKDIRARHSGGDINGEAREVVRLMMSTATAIDESNVHLLLKIIERLSKEPDLLRACHAAPDVTDELYSAMWSTVESDIRQLSRLCLPPTPGQQQQQLSLTLPSWHAVLQLLRSQPGESGYVPPTSGQKGIASMDASRCALYLAKGGWQRHIALCAVLWRAVNAGCPKLYVACKDLWRQLPLCLVHESVAAAVFKSSLFSDDGGSGKVLPFHDVKSPCLQPLLNMLDLHDTADDLEGLTNQVAAILVVQARSINDANVIKAAALERSITARMDRARKMQWKQLSLPVAEAMVNKGGQLEDHEFGRVLQLQQAGLGR